MIGLYLFLKDITRDAMECQKNGEGPAFLLLYNEKKVIKPSLGNIIDRIRSIRFSFLSIFFASLRKLINELRMTVITNGLVFTKKTLAKSHGISTM